MVCESMIHPVRLARGNYLWRDRREVGTLCFVQSVGAGTGLQHVGISNEWRDKAEVPSVVFRTVLGKKKKII